MGMAASQARLLTITARLHDVEYQAQAIQNAKIQLATQNDQVYQEYLAALDATTLTVTDCNKNLITANFNNLCGKNAVDTGTTRYALLTSDDRLIVSDDVYQKYNNFKKSNSTPNPYEFAFYCILGERMYEYEYGVDIEAMEDNVFARHQENDPTAYDESLKNIKTQMDNICAKYINDEGDGDYAALVYAASEPENDNAKKDLQEYKRLEEQYKTKLYNKYAEEIFNETYKNLDESNEPDPYNDSEFLYYVDIFKQIQAKGGCVNIATFDGGFEGDAANNSDWLQDMIKCGKISLAKVDKKSNFGSITFNATSPDTDERISYTTTTTIDKTALAKAEAKYNKETKEIDQKDKRFDMDLSKLETERSALTTEYDSVKKVINENIERTFGIFS